MFAFIIEKYMLKKNISVEELARLTNIDKEYILKIVKNKVHDVNLSTIYKISKALNVEMEELYYSIDDYERLKEELNKKVLVFGVGDRKVKEISYILDLLQNVIDGNRNKNNMIT